MQQLKSTALMEIVKSPNDTRAYRLVMLPNGITSLLISTSSNGSCEAHQNQTSGPVESMETEIQIGEAGAALCLGVGSFSDPPELPGFAHFMEHMVFMGSKKYPKENHWDDFLAKNGGESNAWTDCELTCFYFVVNQPSLAESLDIFAQFFIAPLFNKNAVDREIMAVDNEYQLKSINGIERMRRIVSHLVVEEGHPMKKFMAGNKKSLKDDPEKNNVNVYDMLHTFNKEMYSAHFMTLAICSMEDLDTMENNVMKIFSKIPNNQIPHPKIIQRPFQEKNFNKFIKVVPVEDIYLLNMMWALPSLKGHYKCRVIPFLAILLGHEGKGSILSVLKKKHYALKLSAGNDMTGFTHNSSCTTFLITITLTELGAKAYEEVLEIVFQYILLLRQNLPFYVFEEQKHMEETIYIFKDEEPVYEYLKEVAENMQMFPPEHYLCGCKLYFEYNEQIIQDCIHYLRPENMLLIQYDKSFSSLPGLNEEPWYGTKHKIQDTDYSLVHKLTNLKPHPELQLPEPNLYISTNFKIFKGKRATRHPVVLFDQEECRIWFKKDSKFSTPKALVYLNLITPVFSESSKSFVLGDVYLKMLVQRLREVLYNATIAGYVYYVEGEPDGIVIGVGGYNDKIKLVVENMLATIVNLDLDENDFKCALSHLQQDYRNELMKPLGLARALRYTLLEKRGTSILERCDELSCITLDCLKTFVSKFHHSVFIEGFVTGNMKPQDAKDIGQLALKVVKKSFPLDQLIKPNVLEVPLGEYKCLVPTINKENPNSCVIQYYQQGPGSFYTCFLNELLSAAMSEPLFNNLRTEHQLGYCVFCHSTLTNGVLGYIITIESQAKRFKSSNVDAMITLFLKNFEHSLIEMSEAKFQTLLACEKARNTGQDVDLADEAGRLWFEILKHDYMFDRPIKESRVIEKTTLKDLINWFKTTILGEQKRKLSIMVEGCTTRPNRSDRSTHKHTSCVPNVTTPWINGSEATSSSSTKDTNEKDMSVGVKAVSHFVASLKNEGPGYITDIGKFKSQLTHLPYHSITS